MLVFYHILNYGSSWLKYLFFLIIQASFLHHHLLQLRAIPIAQLHDSNLVSSSSNRDTAAAATTLQRRLLSVLDSLPFTAQFRHAVKGADYLSKIQRPMSLSLIKVFYSYDVTGLLQISNFLIISPFLLFL